MEGSNVIEAKRCIYCRDEKLLGELASYANPRVAEWLHPLAVDGWY